MKIFVQHQFYEVISMKKLIAALLSAVLVLSAAAGCGSFTGKSGGTSASPTNSGGTKPTSVNIYLENEIPTLNQFAASDNIAFNVLNNISEGLYRLDMNNEPQPAMAKDCKISDDKLTYTFTLRDGLKFSNGDAITSKTFKDTWIKQMAADTPNNYAFIVTDYIVNAQEYSEKKATADQIGIQTPDDKTLVVKLKAPTPYFLSLTTFVPYYAVDMSFFEKQGKDYAVGKDNLVYSGPYMISQYDAAAGVELVKNPNYWDAANVQVDTVSIKIIKEQSTALNLYKAGQLSRVQLASTDVPAYKDSEEFKTHSIFRTNFIQFNTTAEGTKNINIRKALSLAIVQVDTVSIKIIKEQSTALNLYKAGQLSRVQLASTDVPAYKDSEEFKTHSIFRTNFIQFNTTAEGTKNINIRKALSLAIDNDTLVSTILNNGSEAANGVVPKAMSSGVAGKTFGSMQSTLNPYDAAKAKEYWAKGVAELGGKAPQLTLVLDDNTENKDVGTYLQSQFKSVLGIEVRLDSKTKEARRTLMKAGTYQMGLNAWGADYDDPMTYLQIWTENKNAFRGNFKDTDAANDYAKLIQSAHGEKDNAKRADLLVQAEKSLITDNAVVAPLYYMGSAYLIKSNVSNLIEPNSGILELKYVTVQ